MNWHSLDWVMKATGIGKRLVPVALCGGMLVVAGQVMPACSATPASSTSPGGLDTNPTPNTTNNACDHPSPGCGCSVAGETAACGTVILHSGNNLQCSMGTTTCDGKTWGACDGSIKVESNKITGGGIAIRGLGSSTTCGAVNPCDPNCFYQNDTAPGLDAGANLAVLEGGLQIAPPPGLNTCNLATNPTTVYSALAGNAAAKNPAATMCTTGVNDNCNYDYACNSSMTCAPYADGTTNAACGTSPDFTLGLGCWDASMASGFELNVCNRGASIASAGTVLVAIGGGTAPSFLSGAPLTATGCASQSSVLSTPIGTQIASASNAVSLPQGTINVASNASWPACSVGSPCTVYVQTSGGMQTVTCKGVSGTTQFTTCTGGTGSMATGNVVSNTNTNAYGTCSIALSTTPVGPGECLSFNVASPPSGISCQNAQGGTVINLSSTAWAMINPPPTIASTNGSAAIVPECDPCNNYASYDFTTDQPPASASAGACVQSWCGVKPGSESSGSIPPCNEPDNLGSMLTNVFTNPAGYSGNDHGPTIPCVSGAGDTCPFDYFCSGSTCSPYTAGQTNAACGAQPDFTVGMGCWDNGSNFNGLEFEVCNRGGATASSGTLQVDFIDSSPSNNTTASCNADAWPQLLQNVGTPNGGYCRINLTNLPLTPGMCTSFNVFSPPANITCYNVAGVTPLTTALFPFNNGNQLAIDVNPPTGTGFTPAPPGGPIAECDVCNNYSTVDPNSAGQAYAACTPSLCGPVGTSTSPCPPGSPTAITGTIQDPGGNVGLPNVSVYVATTAPTVPLQDPEPAAGGLPYCDTCASLGTAGYTNGATTATNGSFTLYVNPGTYTVVSQIGRWRRTATVTAAACTSTPVGTALNMPQNRTQGDIPKMAIVEGSQESFECWMLKVGVAASEFAPYAAGNQGRVDLYESTNIDNFGFGGPTPAGGEPYYGTSGPVTVPPAASQLWGSGASNTINNYALLFLPCDGASDTQTGGNAASAAAETALLNYANAGGRIFMDHFPGQTWIENDGAATPTIAGSQWDTANVASWNDNAYEPIFGGNWTATLQDTSYDQMAFYAWMDYATGTATTFVSKTPRGIMTAVGSDSLDLAQFLSNGVGATGSSGVTVASMWFNVPVTASVGSYCGRVVYNDMHVASGRGATSQTASMQSQSFPASCSNMALSAEELALEYEMFQLGACNLGQPPPTAQTPPPPPPAPLTTQTYTRVYSASCPVGYTISWGFFEWQDTMPTPATGASISFAAATAPDNAGVPGTWGTVVPLGTTNMSTTGMFATTMNSVNTDLVNAGQMSQQWLEVEMTLVPNSTGEGSPELSTWQQLYDCVP